MNPMDYFQCVPNFSEGRSKEAVEAIVDAILSIPGAELRDYSADYDHNRSVMTILGDARSIEAAALSAAKIAVERIDLRNHSGIHPRVGAIDVMPVIPLYETSKESAVQLADRIARRIGDELKVPVFLYEWNARPGCKSALPELRKGGFEGLSQSGFEGNEQPDFGPKFIHPSAGITIVGARGPLVAYNINFPLEDRGEEAAREIAKNIRRERSTNPNLTGVRALGLTLHSKSLAQISMNLTQPEMTSLPKVYRYIQKELEKYGITRIESEVIGVIPGHSLGGESPDDIQWKHYKTCQIL